MRRTAQSPVCLLESPVLVAKFRTRNASTSNNSAPPEGWERDRRRHSSYPENIGILRRNKREREVVLRGCRNIARTIERAFCRPYARTAFATLALEHLAPAQPTSPCLRQRHQKPAAV